MPGINPFKEVIIGDYLATKHGNQILLKKKDGTSQIIELKDFAKFVKEHIPNTPLKQDTFSKSQINK